MKPGIAAAILFFCATQSTAQEVIDGSDSRQPSKDIKTVKEIIAGNSLNPPAVQFRKLEAARRKNVQGFVYCGEVNFPNRYGGYDGFRAFWADIEDKDFRVAGDDFTSREAINTVLGMLDCLPAE